jgi:hypothetical protein
MNFVPRGVNPFLELIWQTHLIRSQNYSSDMENNFGGLVDHSFDSLVDRSIYSAQIPELTESDVDLELMGKISVNLVEVRCSKLNFYYSILICFFRK